MRVIKVGNHPRNLAIDGMHGIVYVLNAGDHTVSSFTTDGEALQTSTALSGTDDVTGLAVAPETGDVFVVSKQQIYVLG